MAIPLPAAKQHEGEYEDLLSLWSDLETALSLLLSKPLLITTSRESFASWMCGCRIWSPTTTTRRCT